MSTSTPAQPNSAQSKQQKQKENSRDKEEAIRHARSTMSHKPVAIITIGMAGAGKSTFVQRVNAYLHQRAAVGESASSSSPLPSSSLPSSSASASTVSSSTSTSTATSTPQAQDKNENEKSKTPTRPPYVINLDPAVTWLPFEPNIDIRDTVDYKQVMKQYNLGPNGGILTALNLFTTKFDQVLDLVGRRVAEGGVGHILIDTPGQIEIFTWSASGAIITSAISSPPSGAPPSSSAQTSNTRAAKSSEDPESSQIPESSPEGSKSSPSASQIPDSSPTGSPSTSPDDSKSSPTGSADELNSSSSDDGGYPTIIAYVVDTPRATASPATFMSNMLYACSILYKTQLPFILVFNKTDVEAADRAKEWMTDFEAFQEALANGSGNLHDSDGEPTYMNSLMTSMSLVLDEFYKTLRAVGVSSLTGDGMKEFFDAVDDAKEEYLRDYLPTLVTARLQREEQLQKARSAAKEDSLRRLMKDLEVDRAKNDRWAQEDDDDDELDVNIIDRSEDRWPGQYVDITRARRPGVEDGEEWEGGRWARPS